MKNAKNQLLCYILLIAAYLGVTAVLCPQMAYAFDGEVYLGQQDTSTDKKVSVGIEGPPEWLSIPVYVPKKTNTGIVFNKTNTVNVDIPGEVREPKLREFKFKPLKQKEFKLKKFSLKKGDFKPFKLKKSKFRRFRLKELGLKPLKLKKTDLKKLSVKKMKFKPFKLKSKRRSRKR